MNSPKMDLGRGQKYFILVSLALQDVFQLFGLNFISLFFSKELPCKVGVAVTIPSYVSQVSCLRKLTSVRMTNVI